MKPSRAVACVCIYLGTASGAHALSEDAERIVSQIEKSGELDRFCASNQDTRKRILQDASLKVKDSLPTQRAKQQFGGFMYQSKPEASEFIREHKC